MLPEYVRIRNFQMLYQSSHDGYNIQNLYRVCSEYKNDYKFSILLIQTKKNQVFGAFIDDVFRLHLKGYIGSNESFVFSIRPQIKVFRDRNANQKYLLGEMNYFQIGSEG